MIQSVRLAVARVAEDGQHLERRVGITAESTNELLLIPHLHSTQNDNDGRSF